MADEFVPTTEEGKAALADGADPEVVRSMEEDGTFAKDEPKDTPDPEHVDDTPKDSDESKGDDTANNDDKDEPAQPNRRVESIPAWKANEMAKKAKEEGERTGREAAQKEFESRLSDAGNKPGGADADDIKSIAEEFGMREDLVPAFIERLGGVVAKKVQVGLSPEDRQALDTVRETNLKAQEAAGFENEWSQTVASPEVVASLGGRVLTPEVKEKVKQLAYSDTYHRYRLADIIRLEADQLFPKGSKSAESGRGGTDRGAQGAKSFTDLSPEDIDGLSDAEFDELSARLAGGQSRFSRTEVPKSTRR